MQRIVTDFSSGDQVFLLTGVTLQSDREKGEKKATEQGKQQGHFVCGRPFFYFVKAFNCPQNNTRIEEQITSLPKQLF